MDHSKGKMKYSSGKIDRSKEIVMDQSRENIDAFVKG